MIKAALTLRGCLRSTGQANASQVDSFKLSRTTSNTGAVLLLRCSDEAFDVVLHSIDGQVCGTLV